MEDIILEVVYKFTKRQMKQNKEHLLNTPETLASSLKPTKIITTKPRTKKKGTAHSIPDDQHRCQGRIWGGEDSVCLQNDKWNYGERCKNRKMDGSLYCGIHDKSLTHGNFFESPPHDHYKKYTYD